jgi:hypothetical protein
VAKYFDVDRKRLQFTILEWAILVVVLATAGGLYAVEKKNWLSRVYYLHYGACGAVTQPWDELPAP